MKITDDYLYESEEEEEKEQQKEQQTSKKSDKKEPPKKPTKYDASKFNEWVNKKEKRINSELFKKHFNIQRPSDMLKEVYNTNDKNKNNKFGNVIKNGLSDLKNQTENIGEKEKKLKNQMRQ